MTGRDDEVAKEIGKEGNRQTQRGKEGKRRIT